MNQRNILLLFFVSCFFFSGSLLLPAQNQAWVDSLENLLKDSKNDTVKVNIMGRLVEKLVYNETPKAFEYAMRGLFLSEQIGYKKGIAVSHRGIGFLFSFTGNFDSSKYYFDKAIIESEQINDRRTLGMALSGRGLVLKETGKAEEALADQMRAMTLFESLGDSLGMGTVLEAIPHCMVAMSREKILNYFRQALHIFIYYGDENSAGRVLNNIGCTYLDQTHLDSALIYFQQTLLLAEKNDNKYLEALATNNLGLVLENKGEKNHELILNYYMRSLKLYEEIKSNKARDAYWCVGNYYRNIGDSKNAKKYYDKLVQVSTASNDKEYLVHAYLSLAEMYGEEKKFEGAFEYHRLYSAVKDSVFRQESMKQTSELESKYQNEKKQKEIQILSQQNDIQQLQLSRKNGFIAGLVSLAVFILIVSFLLLGQSRLRAGQAKIEFEQKLLRTQMNPHFIFNSLIAIQNYVYNHAPSEAGKYISSFASLMRRTLESSRQEYVTLEKEIETLKYYMELQQLRFGNKFDYRIEVSENLDTEFITLPPMLAQPFIENSIEHGIMNKEDGRGLIIVRFTHKENMLELQVEDNGIGRKKAGEMKSTEKRNHVSLATSITAERLALLNKKQKEKISLVIEDLESTNGQARGTKVTFGIPEA